MGEPRGRANSRPPGAVGAGRGARGRRRPVRCLYDTPPLSLLLKGELLLGFPAVGLSDVAGGLAAAAPTALRRPQLLRHPFRPNPPSAVADPPCAGALRCSVLCRAPR